MDERGYVAQALLDRLQDDGVPFVELEAPFGLAVPRAAFDGMPRRVARFCQDIDLRLVQLARPERETWQFVLAWGDEVGRPSFFAFRVVADYYRAARRILSADELQTRAPDVLFLHALLEAIEEGALDEARAAHVAALWSQHPRAAIERLGRVWRERRDVRLLAHAARHGDWRAVRADLTRLRGGWRRRRLPSLFAAWRKIAPWPRPVRATVAFVGAHDPAVRSQVAAEMAAAFPAGELRVVSRPWTGRARGIDVAVVSAEQEGERLGIDEVIALHPGESTDVAAVRVEAALVRWLECRIEQRHPHAVVGANPRAARLLQLALRYRIPLLADCMGLLLNTSIECRLRTPLLMPYPYGIVVHRNASLGRRVTIMQQAAIGPRHPADPGAPVIEDNVFVGPGAKILGPVRIGRSATVGANAVVTRDVPSHCTVVGANRILGPDAVGRERQAEADAVVNT